MKFNTDERHIEIEKIVGRLWRSKSLPNDKNFKNPRKFVQFFSLFCSKKRNVYLVIS